MTSEATLEHNFNNFMSKNLDMHELLAGQRWAFKLSRRNIIPPVNYIKQ